MMLNLHDLLFFLVACVKSNRRERICNPTFVCWLSVIAIMLAMLASCTGKKSCSPVDRTRYAQVDSMLSGICDVDSLAAEVSRYHDKQDVVGELVALMCQGRLLRNQSRYDEAVAAHTRFLDLATANNDTIEMSLAYSDLGNDYRRIGDLSRANGYFFKALKLCDQYSDKESKDAITAHVNTLNGIGNIEIELYNFTAADSILREALKGEIKLDRKVGMAINYANLGTAKRYMGDMDSAWICFRKSMECNKLVGNDKGVALCHLHFGELYEDERKFSHAIEEYKLAYDMLKPIGDSWHWLESSLSLARVSILLGEEDDASLYLNEAETEAYRIGSKEHQAKANMMHYELSLLKGNSQEALKHYILGTELLDSIYGLVKSDEMRTQRIEYERERNSGELDVLNRDISHLKHIRNMQISFLAALLLMAGGIIAILVYANRVRRRTQRLMRQVEETRSLFFTNVVHQLRTPLTVIMGAIDGIVADIKGDGSTAAPAASLSQKAEIVEHQGNNLLTLMDRILEVGNVRSALRDPDWRSGDVVAFLRMVVESYREQSVARHIELNFAPRESVAQIDFVPNYLNTIMGSLLENAIAYSREFSRVTVTSRVENDELVIRVADNGMGISKADLPHVFEPFYRSAAAEQQVDGVGIGLTVARDMVMAMGGSVAADSRLGHGSVFTMRIPCHKRNQGMIQPLEMVAAPVRKILRRDTVDESSTVAGDSQDGRSTILVIEDHNDVARLIGDKLGEQYLVSYASDGEMGFVKAGELLPDLIITDVKMPLMDGLELCRRVRASKRLRHIPVIMLSARSSVDDRIRGIEAGADVYMEKPFVADELRMWVSKMLEMRSMLHEAYTQRPDEEPCCDSDAPCCDNITDEDRKFLDDVARLVDEQLSSGVTKLNIDKIALSFKMGESQFKRKVQALTGKNVTTYVSQLRMEKAMDLLRNRPDLLVGDIAEQCGYADVAYFSRVFRMHYGFTPTQARNGNGNK